MQRGWAGYALEPRALQAALDVAVSNLSGSSWCHAVAVCWIIHHAAAVHMTFCPGRIGARHTVGMLACRKETCTPPNTDQA